MITYEDLRKFCYSNDQLITAPIRGVCLDFFGLNNTAMFWEDSERAVKFAEQGIIYVLSQSVGVDERASGGDFRQDR